MTPAGLGQFDRVVANFAGWVVVIFIALVGGTIIYYMLTGKINLSRLISEPNGDASTSRLQLLIFTFVIAMSLFLIVAANGALPDIPNSILVLLGISGSSYLVSKGIQFSNDAGIEDREPALTVSPNAANATVNGSPVMFTVNVIRETDERVTWGLDPPVGTVDQTGKYTPPAAVPVGVALPAKITLSATSAVDASVSDVAVITLNEGARNESASVVF